MATIDEIKKQAATIKNATAVGENTASRVGTAIGDLADYVGAQVVQTTGTSTTSVMSQKAVSDGLKALSDKNHYSDMGFVKEVLYDGGITGSEIGTLIEGQIPYEFEPLENCKNGNLHKAGGFNTYIITNDTNNQMYVYANFTNNAQYSRVNGHGMKWGIYDAAGNLLKSTLQVGSLMFCLLYGYTLVVSSNNWIQTPIEINESLASATLVTNWLKGTKLSASNYYYQTRGLVVTKEIDASNSNKATFSWNAQDPSTIQYAYSWVIYQNSYKDANRMFRVRIKNTGENTITVGLGLSYVRDWSKGFLNTIKDVELSSGESKILCISNINIGYTEGTPYYLMLVLYGNLGANIFANGAGSFEYEILTQSDLINALNAENALNALNALNAGFSVGAKANDAVIYDKRGWASKDYTAGAMTLTVVDARTIHLTTNFDAETPGTAFRGVYWKIKYDNFEDLKNNTFALTCSHKKYNAFYVLPELGGWDGFDAVLLPLPVSGSANWDLYNIIMDAKPSIEEKGKWTGALVNNGYFYVTVLEYHDNGLCEPFEDTLTLDKIPSTAKVVATDYTSAVEQRIKDLISGTEKIQVTNWGDSLTVGLHGNNHSNQETVLNAIKEKGYPDILTKLSATSHITYPIMMQALLGSKYNVTNCGVGGETIQSIAARLGANAVFAPNDFTLPADTTAVEIGTRSSLLNGSWENGKVALLLQGAGNSVNPCYVEGIECTLKWTGSSYYDTNGKYTIQRNVAGDRDVTISSQTPIIMSGAKLYRNTKIAVLWCFQNGGYSSNEDLIEKLNKMISHLPTDKYIVIGLHSGTKESQTEQEQALAKQYGAKFFNWREYASTNMMYDFGLTPTEADLEKMAVGSMPSTFLVDAVHLGAAGYAILGYKIIERFKILGYIE